MTKPAALLVFCFLLSSAAQAQNHELDSLYEVLNTHPQRDTLRALTLLRVCYLESNANPDRSKNLAEEALAIAKQTGFGRGVGSANRYIAQYYNTVGDHATAIRYAYEMLSAYEAIDFPKGIGQANQLIGIIHEEDLNFDKAVQFYIRALEVYKAANLKRDLGYCYNSLGSLNVTRGDLAAAEQYFIKALEIRKELNDQDGLGQSYGNLAYICAEQKKYDAAIDYFAKARPLVEMMSNKYRLSVNEINEGDMYISMGNFARAESLLQDAVALANAMSNKYVLRDAYEKLTRLHKEKHDYSAALNYQELASVYRDSIYTDERAKQIAEMEARFDAERKDQIIQLLSHESEIQKLWTTIIITVLSGVLLLLSVLYLMQRLRVKKDRRILNLEIDYLSSQNQELAEKYKDIIGTATPDSIESADQRLLKKIIEVIDANLSDPAFSVEQMAKETGMSRTNLHRKIKDITGFPPRELIRNIRMRKAATLLVHEADSVSQISLAVGFDDHSYFTKAFKKHFGVTPSEYTKHHETLPLNG